MLEATLSGLAFDVQIDPPGPFVPLGPRYPGRLFFCKWRCVTYLIWQNTIWHAEAKDDED
jgi:hypothetical protein